MWQSWMSRLLGSALLATAGSSGQAAALPGAEFVFEPAADASIFADVTGVDRSWDDVADGQGASLWTDTTAGGVLRRALLRFDLGGVPQGWQVSAVTLSLYENRARGVHDLALHRVLSAWGEGPSNGGSAGVGDVARPGDTTWRWRDYGVTEWQTRGGDFAAQASASTFVGAANSIYTWGSTPGLVADVQLWLAQPSLNHGWILIGPELDAQNAKRFDSGESDLAALRPRLTVVAAPIPEPATLWMAALGALALVPLLRRARSH